MRRTPIDSERLVETGGKVTVGSFKEAVTRLKKYGFTKRKIGVYFMYGLPGQGLEKVKEGVRFLINGAEGVLQYLSRHTHRIAISNYRILKLEDGKVSFLWRDYSESPELMSPKVLSVKKAGSLRSRYCSRPDATVLRGAIDGHHSQHKNYIFSPMRKLHNFTPYFPIVKKGASTSIFIIKWTIAVTESSLV
jgi:hypothetical protein